MGFRPPPPPISVELYNERWKAGARTMKELDPDFAAWLEGPGRHWRSRTIDIAIVGAIVGYLAGFLYLRR